MSTGKLMRFRELIPMYLKFRVFRDATDVGIYIYNRVSGTQSRLPIGHNSLASDRPYCPIRAMYSKHNYPLLNTLCIWHGDCSGISTNRDVSDEKNKFGQEIMKVASISTKYLNRKSDGNSECGESGTAAYNALIYSTRSDLTTLLIETKTGIDRLPILYLMNASA